MPDLVELGGTTPWPVLPPGIHDASINEIAARFATTPHRQWLFEGFLRAIEALRAAGCATAYLDGSFVTAKPHPDDFDGCWEHQGMDFALLDPVLLRFGNKRAEQKQKYLGEMFPALTEKSAGGSFLDFFQIEKFSGRPKGILRVTLATLKGAST